MIVKGKQQLCTSNDYKRHFKSIQGRNGFTLFERYKELESIVNKHIDGKYRHFLAQPEVDGNNIVWFTQDYHEVPKRLSDLEGQERAGYEKVKNDTLAHYRKAVGELEKQNKAAEAETLGNAIKFVNDDFVYCYDGKTVLGIWGMELRDEVREPLGIAMQNAFEKPKKKKTEEEPDEPGKPDEGNPSEISAPDNVGAATADPPTPEPGPEPDPEPDPEEPLKVRFFGGEHGTLNGQTEYDKRHGEKVVAGEIPEVVPEEGYRFAGWDKNPVNHVVTENTDFIARYEEIEEKKPWWGFFWGEGCLNWLLLLLLLALLGLLLWYLLGRHSLNFCGCDCGCNEVVDPPRIEQPRIDTIHEGDDVPPPTENCGVHFSGVFLSDKKIHHESSIIFSEDPCGEYVGQGFYTDNTKTFPKAVATTFDAIAVDKGTRLIMYSKRNFEGEILLDVVGPMLISNEIWKENTFYDELSKHIESENFTGDLQTLFPPERRQWSSGDMHAWSYGSCKIICEQCKK